MENSNKGGCLIGLFILGINITIGLFFWKIPLGILSAIITLVIWKMAQDYD